MWTTNARKGDHVVIEGPNGTATLVPVGYADVEIDGEIHTLDKEEALEIAGARVLLGQKNISSSGKVKIAIDAPQEVRLRRVPANEV